MMLCQPGALEQHQHRHPAVVHSYIGNFIITRETIFLLSLIALVISWRTLLHVLFHRHRVVGMIRDHPAVGFVLESVGSVFDEAMRVYSGEEYEDEYD